MFDFLSEYALEKEKEEQEEHENVQGQDAGLLEEGFVQSRSLENVFILSLGGSLFFEEKPLVSKIAKFAQLLSRLLSEGQKFVLVVGGGKIARSYVSAIKSFGGTNFTQDKAGIMLTKANAFIFIQAIEKSYPLVLSSPLKALQVLEKGQVPVFGGIMPSFTTDAVAALVAEAVKGKFVNLTNVDGIYSSDPKKMPNARLFREISYEKLLSLIKLSSSKPGQNLVLDLACVNILRRSNIQGVVLNGDNLENFEAFIKGQDFVGTIISGQENKGLD